MKTTILTLSILLSACAPVAQDAWQTDQCMRARLFKQCMQILPAGPVATHYNDWSEVIAECHSHAYYVAQKRSGAQLEICEGAIYESPEAKIEATPRTRSAANE